MFTARVNFDADTAALLRELNLQSDGLVQQTIDNAVARYAVPYCPFEEGVLAFSPFSHHTPGEVEYSGPYARYLFYGIVYGPNIPIFEDDSGEPTGYWSPPGQKKHPTGAKLQYNTDMNPLAGPFWIDRMKADHINDIVREAKSVVGAH